jgi:hypothetical protein
MGYALGLLQIYFYKVKWMSEMDINERTQIIRDDLIFQYQFEADLDEDSELMDSLKRVIQHYSTEQEFEQFLKETA